ncbi:hypothetical protein BU24DRAFT_423443 [Aaosphaeria arxii CBS 175.79]|uniref:Uncharacterized protein n=1 Tax=Aaosphaeria arxii CBS 175.79 TaxID=1450172 RepID=A0A6A5XNU2_9PLEO|nr:uncharacterized protein BU24DRAFT_423443 [Aaosphaeria arxii CBS 175.79]KAF2014517.1 hypothetical protein BU24DRAFT_423443 [Aaosphaeria arxii CBS 175.79]
MKKVHPKSREEMRVPRQKTRDRRTFVLSTRREENQAHTACVYVARANNSRKLHHCPRDKPGPAQLSEGERTR